MKTHLLHRKRFIPLTYANIAPACHITLDLLDLKLTMFKEFFCKSDPYVLCKAWIGSLLIVGHLVYASIISRQLVDWQARFYDHVAQSTEEFIGGSTYHNVVNCSYEYEIASGISGTEFGSEESEDGSLEDECTQLLRSKTAAASVVSNMLLEFAWLVTPMAIMHPLLTFVRRHFVFAWRIALMQAYTMRWVSLQCVQIEGISQRIQEDTQRFASGLQTCVTEVLSACITLGIFAPELAALGSAAWPPPMALSWIGSMAGTSWLLFVAHVLASIGWTLSLVIARTLVGLEVKNQVVEAECRRRLVIVEVGGVVHSLPTSATTSTTTSTTTSATSTTSTISMDATKSGSTPYLRDDELPSKSRLMHSSETTQLASGTENDRYIMGDLEHDENEQEKVMNAAGVMINDKPSAIDLADSYDALKKNYHTLFWHFFRFDAWISVWDQGMVIVPYLMVAPMLFRTDAPSITLGTMMKTATVFDRVFRALALPAFNWAQVNDFRSVIRRLRLMETELGIRARRHKFIARSCNRQISDQLTGRLSVRPSTKRTTSAIDRTKSNRKPHLEVVIEAAIDTDL